MVVSKDLRSLQMERSWLAVISRQLADFAVKSCVFEQRYSLSPGLLRDTRKRYLETQGRKSGLARVSFEYSTDNVNYTPLGDGSFSGASWSLTGLNLPLNQNIYVRTRGNYNGGVGNASGSVVGAVRNVFFGSAATPTPTPVSSVTPMPSLTPTVAPTPTPIPTATPAQLPVCGLITDFENISSLPTEGWVSINDSTVVGGTGWFQGNAGVFSAQSGTPTSYIAANFYNEARHVLVKFCRSDHSLHFR